MTTGDVELTFKTTSEDWNRAQSVLDRLALRRQNPLSYIVTHKAVTGAIDALMPCVLLIVVVYFLGNLQVRSLGEFFSASTLLSLAVVLLALFFLRSDVKKSVARFRSNAGPSRTGREGVHWGAQQVIATSDSLQVRLSQRRSEYDWSAFTDLRKTRDFVVLQIASKMGVAIPRHAFKAKADEKSFCDFFRGRRNLTADYP